MLSHNNKPELDELSDNEFQRLVEKHMGSSYHKHIEDLRSYVIGKKVISSVVGSSGYLLNLDDNSWVLSFFDNDKFDWRVGKGKPSTSELKLLNESNIFGGRNPLNVDLPYANEACDIEREIAQAHGKPIINLAIGERSFNFCFPDSMELDVMLFPSENGQIVWRVFWEQW